MLAEPLVDLVRGNRGGWTCAEGFFQNGVFGPVMVGGEMRFGILHSHLGKLAKGDGFVADQFRQLDLAPRIDFALLIQRAAIALATDFLAVLLAVNVVVDPSEARTGRALEYAFVL